MSDTWRQYPPMPVVIAGSAGQAVAESLTDGDAVEDVLTFSEPITAVEVIHTEDGPELFVINGITIAVPPGGWRSHIAGTPGVTVELPEGVTGIIVNRLV